jgi:hypothetical protein
MNNTLGINNTQYSVLYLHLDRTKINTSEATSERITAANSESDIHIGMYLVV